ncbi:hypothetical protein T12_5989 [Trichinella patagoniensis]|uniref:Uncharacterized protein n=1 Tax=Trichinella patagoniensis TaxID=990121 RepID=A0A0V1A873_9BILA|nr:hypothetical protein T12_5989 [Trichinella patagoniensis]
MISNGFQPLHLEGMWKCLKVKQFQKCIYSVDLKKPLKNYISFKTALKRRQKKELTVLKPGRHRVATHVEGEERTCPLE